MEGVRAGAPKEQVLHGRAGVRKVPVPWTGLGRQSWLWGSESSRLPGGWSVRWC